MMNYQISQQLLKNTKHLTDQY